jgi:hypothetical protein
MLRASQLAMGNCSRSAHGRVLNDPFAIFGPLSGNVRHRILAHWAKIPTGGVDGLESRAPMWTSLSEHEPSQSRTGIDRTRVTQKDL